MTIVPNQHCFGVHTGGPSRSIQLMARVSPSIFQRTSTRPAPVESAPYFPALVESSRSASPIACAEAGLRRNLGPCTAIRGPVNNVTPFQCRATVRSRHARRTHGRAFSRRPTPLACAAGAVAGAMMRNLVDCASMRRARGTLQHPSRGYAEPGGEAFLTQAPVAAFNGHADESASQDFTSEKCSNSPHS
jgi:hypothetical protein